MLAINDSRHAIKIGNANMGRVLIRNVDDSVLSALRARAAARGLSLEAELREVLTRAAGHPRADLAAEFAAVRALTPPGPHPLAEELVRESRAER
jgi:plasmid stability protein